MDHIWRSPSSDRPNKKKSDMFHLNPRVAIQFFSESFASINIQVLPYP